MRSADWKLIGNVGLVLGVFFIVIGFYAYYVRERTFIGWIEYPYRYLAFPLVIIGITLFVVGLACHAKKSEEQKLEQNRTQFKLIKVCPQCKAHLPEGAKFCPNCGTVLKNQ